MNIPLEFFIIVSSIIGASIGMLVMRIYYHGRIVTTEKQTWKTAERFYKALAIYQNPDR